MKDWALVGIWFLYCLLHGVKGRTQKIPVEIAQENGWLRGIFILPSLGLIPIKPRGIKALQKARFGGKA